MKKIFLIILLFITFQSFAQVDDDSTKYTWYKYQYGIRISRIWADSVMKIPTFADTSQASPGLRAGDVMIDSVLHRFHFKSGGIWREPGAGQLFGVSGQDDVATQNRSFDNANFNFSILGSNNFSVQTTVTPGDRYSLLSMDSTQSKIQISFDTSYAVIQTALVDEGGGDYTAPFVDLVAGSTVVNSHLHIHNDRIEFHAYDGNFDIEGLKNTTSDAVTLMTWDSLTNRTAHIPLSSVGGSQSLQEVSEIGNSSTLNIISYDTLKGQDGRYNASVFIGESDVLRSDSSNAYGTSITNYSGLTQAEGFASRTALRFGLKRANYGSGGATVDYLYSRLHLIPNKDALHGFAMLEYNMNDAASADTTTWKTKMQVIIDTFFARGWNGDDDMILIAGPYTEEVSVPYITDYVTATKTIGAVNNIPVADAYAVMAANGGAALTQDGVHPTALGHYYIYQAITQAAAWYEYPGQLNVTGDAHISRTLFAGGDPSSIAYYKYNAAGVFNKTAHFLDDVFIGTDTTEISNSKINISTSSGQIGVGIKQAAVTTSSYHYAGQSQWINSSGQALTITPTTISVSSGNTEFIRQGGSSLWLGGYNGNNTFNDDAIDMDFIVKTDNDATALYGNGGTDQVIIGAATLNTSAKFGIVSTTKGFLPPVMTAAQEAAIGTPTAGLQVYQTDTARMRVYNGSAWKSIAYLDDLSAGGGATPGIDDVLAEGQALTTARTVNQNSNDILFSNTSRFYITTPTRTLFDVNASGGAVAIQSPNGNYQSVIADTYNRMSNGAISRYYEISDSLREVGLGLRNDTTGWRIQTINPVTGAKSYANWLYAGSSGGSGDVTKVGTPVNNQIGVWTGDGTIEGDANFTWTGTEALIATATDNGAYVGQFGGDVFIGGNTLKFGTTANTRIVGITNGMYMLGNTQTALGVGSGTYLVDVRATGVAIGGSFAASAWGHFAAGTTATAPVKFTSGTNLTTPAAGAMEYNGTNLFFTPSSATRNNVLMTASVNSVSPTSPDRTITVVIDGTTYYIAAKTTND